jgi:hydrogenase maturation protein HypF
MTRLEARRISVTGVVQGVGFRPFVYQAATENHLSGWVQNTSGDVTIVVEGEAGNIKAFLERLKAGPPQAHIEDIRVAPEPLLNLGRFQIEPSLVKENEYQLISPDLATCQDCRREIFDPKDRRFRYPFTNCTNCGPRFTIIEDIPYDRMRTTMRNFRMCPKCQEEYDDPLNRRFHAQPNACPECGPQLQLADGRGLPVRTNDVISRAAALLKEGQIVAIKGLGGFLLACDATKDQVVHLLRERKHRPAKPFAIMLKDLESVRLYCQLNPQEIGLLSSTSAPIVLLRGVAQSVISPAVAPNLNYLGVMLPYTPLHHLLLNEVDRPLVMTSGNLSEEPIASENAEALERLQGIADHFVLHNRDIYSKYDDSVVMADNQNEQVVRRARGLAPFPIGLPFSSRQVLACGAELKNTFCLTRDNHAFLSQHIGDLENEETLEHFERTINLYEKLFRLKPEIMACDLHPDYLSSKWARGEALRRDLPLVEVQHHYAHVLSCMVENGVNEKVIGVALDGSGYGSDGKIWGGEFILADYAGFDRKAHFEYLPLPGGSAAISNPYRLAIGYLYFLLGAPALNQDWPPLRGVDPVELEIIQRQVDLNFNSPLTSSCGRLFDVVSALLGVCQRAQYEGQAEIGRAHV